jgi:hypothetical protein
VGEEKSGDFFARRFGSDPDALELDCDTRTSI